jgi:hypothetical protein
MLELAISMIFLYLHVECRVPEYRFMRNSLDLEASIVTGLVLGQSAYLTRKTVGNAATT